MADRGAHRRDARSSWYAVEVHGAGAAQCGAAAELGASHAEQVPQDPKQGHVGWRIDSVTSAVDCQCDHRQLHGGLRSPRPSSRPIHSRMYGAQCTSATPSHSQATDRKSTRLNSSHGYISYAVFCLKKKKNPARTARTRDPASATIMCRASSI